MYRHKSHLEMALSGMSCVHVGFFSSTKAGGPFSAFCPLDRTMVVNCVDMSKGKGKAKSKPMPKTKSKISVLTKTEINTRSRSRSRARARPTQGQNKDKGRGKDKGKDKDKDKVCLHRDHQDCDGSGPFCHLEFVGSEACRTRSHNHRRVLEFLASDSD